VVVTQAISVPFAVGSAGRLRTADGDEALRSKVVQVLLTTPGERVDLPEFGCGLLNLVFEPNDELLAAAMGFTVGQALTRWLGDEIIPAGVDVSRANETVVVEVAYFKRADLSQRAVRVRFR
jgi:Bacteriophage baseplate protein W